MNMPADKNICAEMRRHFIFIGVGRQEVPVIYDDTLASREYVSIGRYRRFQNVFIKLGVAVAACYHERDLRAVNQFNQILRVIIFATEIYVPRSVIQHVTCVQNKIGVREKFFYRLLNVNRVAVRVAHNSNFQIKSLLSFRFYTARAGLSKFFKV